MAYKFLLRALAGAWLSSRTESEADLHMLFLFLHHLACPNFGEDFWRMETHHVLGYVKVFPTSGRDSWRSCFFLVGYLGSDLLGPSRI